MKIGLDASYSIDRQPSGVGLYSARLIEALAEAAPQEEFTLCYRANRYLRSLRLSRLRPNLRRGLLEPIAIPRLARRVDLFHGLNQRLPQRRFRRAVTTFHDLFVMTSEYSTPDYRERFESLARQAAERSDRIAAVSSFTADQTAELLAYPRDRIVVVPHGVDVGIERSVEELERFRRERGLQRPFLLNVGAVQERKNIRRLIEAFERLSDDLLLVLAGASGYGSEQIETRIATSPAKDRILQLGYVDAETKNTLYLAAHALAFPSLDEGFGLPLLEAMAAGLPVLTSDRSAMPEVAGDAAVLVDPLDVDSMTEGLERIVEDQTLRSELSGRGRERVKAFTWTRTAESCLALYRQVIGV